MENKKATVAYSPDKRYLKLEEEIGRGSFKTVNKGLDLETGVGIAWCEFRNDKSYKSKHLQNKDEISVLKNLQHRNILRLLYFWEVTHQGKGNRGKVFVFITELMTSGTLKGYMRRLKDIKPELIRKWGRQILQGLYYLHTRTPPVIHRDLKCDNIFINGTTGQVKIGDFGLATQKWTEVRSAIGTPEFMAPEIYEESYNESVDVYAFGMCLLEMSTGEYPYKECSSWKIIYQRVTQGIKPKAIEKIKNTLLHEVIANCTIVKKDRRYDALMLLNHEFFAEGVKNIPPNSKISSNQPGEAKVGNFSVAGLSEPGSATDTSSQKAPAKFERQTSQVLESPKTQVKGVHCDGPSPISHELDLEVMNSAKSTLAGCSHEKSGSYPPHVASTFPSSTSGSVPSHPRKKFEVVTVEELDSP